MARSPVTFANDPLTVFGLLFQYPSPVEISITKYCFQGCRYCFANKNKEANGSTIGSREDSTDVVIKRIQRAHGQGFNPSSFIDYYIAAGYPLMFSNTTDPFMPQSEKDFKCGERVLNTCLEYEQPMFILTKEVYTPNVRDLLIKGKDLFSLYVTITNSTDEGSKKWEPNAPLTSERLRRIKDLTDNGVYVSVGINPYVGEWVGNARDFIKRIAEAGASEIFLQPMHTDAKRDLVTDAETKVHMKERVNEFIGFDAPLLKSIADEFGLTTYSLGLFPRVTHGISPHLPAFPIDINNLYEDLYDVYVEQGKKPILVTWDMIDKYYSRYDEWDMVFKVSEMMNALVMTSEGHKDVDFCLGKENTVANIFKYHFNNSHRMACDLVCEMVDATSGVDGKLPIHARDEDGNLMYVFHPDCQPSQVGKSIDIDKEEVLQIELELEMVSSEEE